MELGGWKSYEMVLRYEHLAPDHLSSAATRIERTWDIVGFSRFTEPLQVASMQRMEVYTSL